MPGGEKALERHLLLLAQHMWETEAPCQGGSRAVCCWRVAPENQKTIEHREHVDAAVMEKVSNESEAFSTYKAFILGTLGCIPCGSMWSWTCARAQVLDDLLHLHYKVPGQTSRREGSAGGVHPHVSGCCFPQQLAHVVVQAKLAYPKRTSTHTTMNLVRLPWKPV